MVRVWKSEQQQTFSVSETDSTANRESITILQESGSTFCPPLNRDPSGICNSDTFEVSEAG